MESTITRRSFLGGAAVGAAALALGEVAESAFGAELASDETQWDAEYDVVVLGFGNAGANAAVSAYEEGAKVLICEKAPTGQEPCNSKASGQIIMGTDDAEGLYIYLSKLCGKYNNYEDEVLHAFCEECASNFNWLVDTLGANPDLAYPAENPGENPESTEFGNPEWTLFENLFGMGRPGYIDVWNEFSEIPESIHCLALMTNGEAFNGEYYKLCQNAVAQRKGDRLEVWLGAPGKRLIADDWGSVVGVVVEKDGAEIRVKANGGVVLATGGFEANPDMISSYTQMPYTYLRAGTMNTGDGIKMAQSVGADLWHMSNVSGYQWAYQNPRLSTCTSLGMDSFFEMKGIFAGIKGKRFQNEFAKGRHGRIDIGGAWISTPMPVPVYYIAEAAAIDGPMIPGFSEDNSSELADGQIIQGATIEELSAAIREIGDAPEFNLNGELDIALEKYNRHCHANDGAGEEDDWGRMCTMPIENGPFYAVKIGPTLFNTQGGPRRNKYGQVINVDGMPIAGLFSAGEIGSIFPDMYNGGGNNAEGMVYGRVSGANAAKRAFGAFEGATQVALTQNEVLASEAADIAPEAGLDLTGIADGTYEGDGHGFGGNIHVTITVENGKIVSCEGVGLDETPQYGGTALPAYCEKIVEEQDIAAVDIVAGASNTLRGFKEAVAAALQ
ncbi:MAG: FAD-binding protein [Coriobacteriales bacterium]|nr:FAD-binding protein [Coriobacteriales bacterium]